MAVAVVLPNAVIPDAGGLPFLGGCLFQSRLENFLLKTVCDLSQIWGQFVNSGLSQCPKLLVNCGGNKETKSWFLNLKLNEAGWHAVK